MKRMLIALAAAAALAGPVSAQSLESMSLATNLGDVLASEAFCGLAYDQDAIQAYIGKHVRADDMSFPSTLDMMVMGQKAQMEDFSASQKTAHCAQVGRIAKSYGFVK